jgi:hypothetical protein
VCCAEHFATFLLFCRVFFAVFAFFCAFFASNSHGEVSSRLQDSSSEQKRRVWHAHATRVQSSNNRQQTTNNQQPTEQPQQQQQQQQQQLF